MSDTEHLSVSIEDGIGRVTIDRPGAFNAIDADTAETLQATLEALAADDDVRCLLLTGTEGVYCTGADLSTFDGDERDAETLESIATPLHGSIRAMTGAPKPVVAGVNGVAAGGGLGLALAADVVLVSAAARFEYAYPKIGLSGDGGATWFLPRLLGLRRAQAFALLDEPIDAEEAVERGLATEAVPADDFDERLAELASQLANGPTLAYAELKTLLRESATNTLDEQLADEKARITGLADTDDYAAGLRGFLEKESPTFEGR